MNSNTPLSELESYVISKRIFIDTCSILHDKFEILIQSLVPLLKAHDSHVIVPNRCIEELHKHSRNSENVELMERATTCVALIEKLITQGYVVVRGEKSDGFADNVFQSVFTKFRMNYNLLLITQDHDLSEDILALNHTRSVHAKKICVCRINFYGSLTDFENPKLTPLPFEQAVLKDDQNHPPELDAFIATDSTTTISDLPIEVNEIPSTYDMVLMGDSLIRLTEQFYICSDCTYYSTNTPYVAKIFHKNIISLRVLRKLELILSKKISCQGISYPQKPLFNGNNELLGYLTEKWSGINLRKGLFTKQAQLNNFMTWRRTHLVQLCITILKKILFLQDRNIVIDTISPENIFVKSPTEVYLINTDSFRFQDFPCTTHQPSFTWNDVGDNSQFSIAMLLFMILLPGKSPFIQTGKPQTAQDRIFHFSVNEASDNQWDYVWSSLSAELQEGFYSCFGKKGSPNFLATEEWIRRLKNYLSLLNSNAYKSSMYMDIFPAKRCQTILDPNSCFLCGNPAVQNGLCHSCMNQGEHYHCESCGKEMVYTNKQKYIKNASPYRFCLDCYNNSHEIWQTSQCVDCGATFDITNSERDFYSKMGFDTPKRCESCRKNRK